MRMVKGEEGAAAIVIAVCVSVLFGAAAIVIDAGDIWQERRQLVTATDAAALAAAQDEANGVNGCALTANAYLQANSDGSTLSSCTASPQAATGEVTIQAEIIVEHALAKVLGRDQTVVNASSTAEYGIPGGIYGLRPFALCSQSPGFMAWQESGHSTTQVFRITYDKDQPDHCGAPAPGNWGLIDFDGGANSNTDTQEWVQNGYPGLVTSPRWYFGDTGAFSNSLPISFIAGETIQLPVFDDVNTDSGSNTQFHLMGFVSVEIIAFDSNGPEASRYLDIRFGTGIASGLCCDNGSTDTGLRVVTLCAVEEHSSC
jgi:hypothetical protein